MDRSAFVKGMVADMYKWFWESTDKVYKKYTPIYEKIADVKSLDAIKGSYYQGTSAIGAKELQERAENEAITFQDPSEGFTVYAKIRSFDLGVRVPKELQRDFPRAKDFIKNYIYENMPSAVEYTKEKAFAALFNDGGKTAGASIFNQDIPGLLSTGHASLCYDSKPFFALSGNERTAKNGSTYYNGLASTLTDANLQTANNLLTSTNAFNEVGQPFDNTSDKVLVVPTALKLTADRLINSVLRPETQNNDTNVLAGEYEVIANPYFTTSTSWAIGRKKAGIKMWVASTPTFDFWEDKDNKVLKASANIDLAICVDNFRPWVGSNFATS